MFCCSSWYLKSCLYRRFLLAMESNRKSEYTHVRKQTQNIFTLHIESSVWGYSKNCIDVFIYIKFRFDRTCLFLVLRKRILVQDLSCLFNWERWMLIWGQLCERGIWVKYLNSLVSHCYYESKIISSDP